MTRLMQRFGNPKYKAVHIAGTKGKGSTAAFISNILRTEGYSVGCYTRMVFTTRAFILFAEENIDIAAGLGGARDATNVITSSGLAASVITTVGEEHLAALGGSLENIAMAKSGIIKQGRPLVLGGPFLAHIERIIGDKAASMGSPVVSASDAGNRFTIRSVNILNGRPYQSCDIAIQVQKDLKLSCELVDVKLRMIGYRQLQNAATATCLALCLRNLGWRISDESIRTGLEDTCLLGRSQFLTSRESELLGLVGSTILLDGAHIKESARALMNTIRLTFPKALLAFVVVMASDKDHVSFAREILSGARVEAVVLTEAAIAGGVTRTTSAALLRDSWIQDAEELGICIVNSEMPEFQDLIKDQPIFSVRSWDDGKTILATEVSLKTIDQILRRKGHESGIIAITGSLHIVASVLATLES